MSSAKPCVLRSNPLYWACTLHFVFLEVWARIIPTRKDPSESQRSPVHILVQVKAVFPSHGLEMVAQVYSNSKLGCLVVELTRRAGDAFEFNKLRENLAKELGSIISGAGDVKAVASKCVLNFDPPFSRVHLAPDIQYSRAVAGCGITFLPLIATLRVVPKCQTFLGMIAGQG